MKTPQTTYSLRYFFSGESFYMGSKHIIRPVTWNRSRKMTAPSLLVAYRRLRRSLRKQAASVKSIRLTGAWQWDPAAQPRPRWRQIADHRVPMPDGW